MINKNKKFNGSKLNLRRNLKNYPLRNPVSGEGMLNGELLPFLQMKKLRMKKILRRNLTSPKGNKIKNLIK